MRLNYTFILILTFVVNSFSQEVIWVNDSTSTTSEMISKRSVSYDNYYYIAGDFKGDVSIGTKNFVSYGNKDIFISKQTSNGEYVKSIQIGSSAIDFFYDMKVDNNGDIYIVGAYKNDCDFNGTVLTSTGSFDGFIAKYDADLNLIWAKRQAYSSTLQFITAIVIDNNNHLIIAGSFMDSLIVGNPATSDTLIEDQVKSLFLAKFDINGNILDTVQFKTTAPQTAITNISVDNNNNYYLAGNYTGTISYFSNNK